MSALPGPIRNWLEAAYGSGIADIFLYAAPVAFLAFIFTIFIKEVPLRTTGALEQAAQDGSTPAAAPAQAAAPAPAPEQVPSLVGAGQPAADTQTQRLAAVAATAGDAPVGGGTPVRGFVRGAESAPVPRAAVTLISLGGRQLGRAVAQGDGSYSVDAPGAGSYVLIASADGYQPQASTVLVGEESVTYDILLSGTSGLTGVVRASETKAPVAGAMVIVTDVRGDVLATGQSGPAERVHLRRADPGPGHRGRERAGPPAHRAPGRGHRLRCHPHRDRPALRLPGPGHRPGRGPRAERRAGHAGGRRGQRGRHRHHR